MEKMVRSSAQVLEASNGGAGLIPAHHPGSAAAVCGASSTADAAGLSAQRSPAGSGAAYPGSPQGYNGTGSLFATSPSMRKRTHEDNAAPQMPGAVPMPKWPPNHVSEAFESVSFKKSLILSPPEIYAEIAHHGAEKSKFHWTKMALLCIMAGIYCGFGYSLCLLVGGNAPKQWLEDSPGLFSLIFGAVGFPFSFTMIIVCGAELYTSMCAYMMAAWWEGQIKFRTAVKYWVVSWLWNFVGCAMFVGLMYAAGSFHHKDWYIKVLAVKKVSSSFGATLVKGIFANFLVCVATWQANAAQDLTGKAVAIWLPISAFAMFGFEHSIANQFLIPMAIALGAPVTAKQFVVDNLIPATIGNWIGGAIGMATCYAFIYGRPAKEFCSWLEQRQVAMREKKAARTTAVVAAGKR